MESHCEKRRRQQALDLWSNARLFGLVSFALADGYISSFEAKYFYNFWRPITAIQLGNTDGNPDTIADGTWTSFLTTPPIPDNSSGHAIAGAAVARVFAKFFNTDNVSFNSTSGPPFAGITRSHKFFAGCTRER